MKKLFNNLWETWNRSSGIEGNPPAKFSLDKTIEQVITAVDPKMRVIPRYDKKLKKPVQTALNYLNELVSFIPGEEDLLDKNEMLFSLLFKDKQELDKVLSASEDLAEFLLQEKNRKLPYVYFLLCMETSERAFLGVEQHGEILKREVQQISVDFSGHQLLAPAVSAKLAREGFKQCAFNGLVGKIIANITQLNFEYKKLIEAKSQLMNKQAGSAKAKKPVNGILQPFESLTDTALHNSDQSLNDINNQIDKIKSDLASPEVHLQQCIDVLSRPQDFISVASTPINLNKFGIKQTQDSDKKSYCINAAQVVIDNAYERIAVVAAYPVAKLAGLHNYDFVSA